MNKRNENICRNCYQDDLLRHNYYVRAVECARTVQRIDRIKRELCLIERYFASEI